MKILKNHLREDVSASPILNYQKIKTKSTDFILKDSVEFYDYIEKISHKMVKTCLLENGIGLCAPQIGIMKATFIIKNQLNENEFFVYLNPKFKTINDEKWIMSEGCLSVPNKQFPIERHKIIETNYWTFDENKKLINKIEVLDNLMARIYLHERDHISGLSIVDLFERQNKNK